MDNLQTYLYELSNLYLRTVKQYVHALGNIELYDRRPKYFRVNLPKHSQMANQSTRFVGVRWSSWADSYVATVAIGRSKRKNEYSSTKTKTDNVDDETFSD